MSIKLIISDLDGTLLGADSRIAPQTAAALDRANRAGIRLLVATGRSWGSASPLMKQAEVVCDFVLLNGAECRTSKGVLLCARLYGCVMPAMRWTFFNSTSLGLK